LCDHHGHLVAADQPSFNIDLNDYVDRALKNMYAGKTKPGQPDADIVRAEAEEIWKAVKQGWNLKEENIRYGSMEQRILIQMRHNTFVHTVFKRHHYALDMARELFNEKGEVRSFGEFSKAVKGKVDPNYNKNWLRTEYNTAYASGQMARKWQTYVRRGGFIVYVAVMDDRVRYDHARMNKARYPVDHPFWLTHYPPNGWNCRCTTRWDGTEGETVPTQYIDDVPPVFQNNVGMTGVLFKDSPYFTVDGNFTAQAERLFGFKPPVDPQQYQANLQLFNALRDDRNYKLAFVDNLTGGFVFRHLKAEPGDLMQNIKAGQALARRGDSVVIRQIVNQHGVKNPDVLLSGVEAEIKTSSKATFNTIDQALRKAKKQASTIVLSIGDGKVDTIEEALYNRVRQARNIDRVIVIYRDEVYEFSAEEIVGRTFLGKIK